MFTSIIAIALILIISIAFYVSKKKKTSQNPQVKKESTVQTNNQNESQVNETQGTDSEVNPDQPLQEVDLSELPEKLITEYGIATDPLAQKMPVLYALVTCQHCIRTQRFLKKNEVEFKVIHVDLFDGVARSNIMTVLKRFNSRGSFPTLIMPSAKTVVGYREHQIREAIDNDSE